MAAFYTDEDASSAQLITHLRNSHHSVTRTIDIQPGAADADQLAYAARQGWILITHNWRDFCRLHATSQHAGILAIPQPKVALRVLYNYSYAAAARAIDQLVATQPLANRIYVWNPIHGWGSCPTANP